MIAGFPGRTQRFLTPSAVENLEKWFYPLRSRTLSELIAILAAEGKKDPDTALRVASSIKGYGNGETNARGQIEGLARNGVAARARAEAQELAEFLAARKELPADWAAAPAQLEKVLAADRVGQDRRYFLEELERFPSTLGSALSAVRRADERRKPDLEREAGYQDRDLDRARQREKDLTRSLAPAAARKALAHLVARAQAAAGEKPVPAFDEAFGMAASPETIEAKLSEMDAATALGDEKVRLANVDASFALLASSSDPYVKLALGLHPDLAAIRAARKETNGALLVWRPRYLSALEALRRSKGKAIYPDANSTLRVSFATVKGYSPREAVTFTPRTFAPRAPREGAGSRAVRDAEEGPRRRPLGRLRELGRPDARERPGRVPHRRRHDRRKLGEPDDEREGRGRRPQLRPRLGERGGRLRLEPRALAQRERRPPLRALDDGSRGRSVRSREGAAAGEVKEDRDVRRPRGSGRERSGLGGAGRLPGRAVAMLGLAGLLFAGAACRERPRERTLEVLVPSLPSTLDPFADSRLVSRSIFTAIYEPLVEESAFGPRPAIAEMWTNPAPDTWAFRISADAVFHDGSPVTSRDVADAARASRASRGSLAGLADLRSIEIVDERNVRFRTWRPTDDFLLAVSALFIPRRDGESFRGTGAFRVVAHTPDRILLMRHSRPRHPDPLLREVVFRRFVSAADGDRLLARPQAAAVLDPPPAMVEKVRGDPRYRIVATESGGLTYLAVGLSESAGPLRDVRVRRALRLSLDLPELVKEGTVSGGTPAAQLVPPGSFGFDPRRTPPRRDLAEARRLLALAGYPDGRVNAIAPGVIETAFHAATPPERMEAMKKSVPLGRAGTPEDCVGPILFLASTSMGGYVSGQIFHVNGGQFMP